MRATNGGVDHAFDADAQIPSHVLVIVMQPAADYTLWIRDGKPM